MDKTAHKYRHWFQAAWFALTNGYAKGFLEGKIYTGPAKVVCVPGLNCYSCPGAVGSCPIGSLQAVLDSQKFTFSCYVFGFLMAFGALFGRLICGWMCPFGLVQDLLYKIPAGKKHKTLPGHKYLRFLKYVILVAFVLILPSVVVNVAGMGQPWFCEYICPSGTLLGGIPLVAMNEGLQKAAKFRFAWKVGLLLVIAIGSIKVFRPFCKYLCPLGAIYGLFNPISLYRFHVDEAACVKCGACAKACKMEIKVWEQPNSRECIRCGDCKSACPKGAITSTLGELKDRFVVKTPTGNTISKHKYILIFGILFIVISAALFAFDSYCFLSWFIYLDLEPGYSNFMSEIVWIYWAGVNLFGLFSGIYMLFTWKREEKQEAICQIGRVLWMLSLIGIFVSIICIDFVTCLSALFINIWWMILAKLLQVAENKTVVSFHEVQK